VHLGCDFSQFGCLCLHATADPVIEVTFFSHPPVFTLLTLTLGGGGIQLCLLGGSPTPLTNPALILSVHHRRRRVAGEGRLVVAPPCPRYASNISYIYGSDSTSGKGRKPLACRQNQVQ